MKKLNFTILLLLVSQILFTSCNGNSNEVNKDDKNSSTTIKEKNAVILDLTKIVYKTEKEIESIIGKAQNSEIVKGYPCEDIECQRVFYDSGKIEIIYKEGKANRITINQTIDLTSDENALERFGLKNEKPSFKSPNNVIRWVNVQNIAEISCFTDYVLIQVAK